MAYFIKSCLLVFHMFWLVLNLVQVNRSISDSVDPCVDRSELIFLVGFISVFLGACITFQWPPDLCIYLKSDHGTPHFLNLGHFFFMLKVH